VLILNSTNFSHLGILYMLRGLMRSKIWVSFEIGTINVKSVLMNVPEKSAHQLFRVKIRKGEL
jgi:hypothetical protein